VYGQVGRGAVCASRASEPRLRTLGDAVVSKSRGSTADRHL